MTHGIKDSPVCRLAFGLENGTLLRAVEQVFLQSRAGDDDGACFGFIVWQANEPAAWALQADKILVEHPNCQGFVIWNTPGDGVPFRWEPALQAIFVECVHQGSNLASTLLGAARFQRDNFPATATLGKLRDMIRATILQRELEAFSHGGTRDITNHVLAPLRLCLLTDPSGLSESWKKEAGHHLAHFQTSVIAGCDDSWWLGAALKGSFAAVMKHLGQPGSQTELVPELERLMNLLTECRELAGAPQAQVPVPSQREEPISAEPGAQVWPYKILVIDDHARAWRPFFQSLQRHLAERDRSLPVSFTFRTGGERDLGPDPSQMILQQVVAHDAVLVDIHLPSPLSGLDLLNQIRRHSLNVPIILWTSSRALDLTAAAQLAHAFLFKKTATLDAISDTLALHLLEGNAKRRYALHGHFFDNSIRDRANRKAALRISEYCSRHMDSFHALDDQYFRFFTDHGGRHLFKLVEYLGEVLRFLASTPDFFSANAAEREEEILSLYLSVFLHEFGMLRLRGPGEPDWETTQDSTRERMGLAQELAVVRALHAVRGMVMLAKEPPTEPRTDPDWNWPDEEGCHQARKRLWRHEAPYLRSAVALITGHHSRLLPLNLGEDGEWNHDFRPTYLKKAAAAFSTGDERLECTQDEAKDRLEHRFFSPDRVESALRELISRIGLGRLERLRKHCALFRFIDAIDVDQSRNPAHFLCRADKLSPIDCRETLKRQVVRHVRLEGGHVSMETNVAPPSPEIVREIWRAKEDTSGDVERFDILDSWIANPWGAIRTLKDISGPEQCHKAIDAWLAEFWEKPNEVRASFVDFSTPESARRSKFQIAALTALSVAGEILSEYRAIFETGLQSYVTLGTFWRNKNDPPDWATKQEKMLSILFHPVDGLSGIMKRVSSTSPEVSTPNQHQVD